MSVRQAQVDDIWRRKFDSTKKIHVAGRSSTLLLAIFSTMWPVDNFANKQAPTIRDTIPSAYDADADTTYIIHHAIFESIIIIAS